MYSHQFLTKYYIPSYMCMGCLISVEWNTGMEYWNQQFDAKSALSDYRLLTPCYVCS